VKHLVIIILVFLSTLTVVSGQGAVYHPCDNAANISGRCMDFRFYRATGDIETALRIYPYPAITQQIITIDLPQELIRMGSRVMLIAPDTGTEVQHGQIAGYVYVFGQIPASPAPPGVVVINWEMIDRRYLVILDAPVNGIQQVMLWEHQFITLP